MSYSTDPIPVVKQGDILTCTCVGQRFVEHGRVYELYQVLLCDREFMARCFPVEHNPRETGTEMAEVTR